MRGDNNSGRLGEIHAAKYLADNGYNVLETNYKTSFSEIDIIAKDKSGTLCFIEVKTRKNKNYGYGADFIFKSKIQKMILGAKSYIALSKFSGDIRFDIIEVYGYALRSGFVVDEINHIKNAFDV
ncbi:MAG: YraN family protein [Clostridia bacterium]|nr:YraN family protein [Clostridia bacterium]